MSKSKDSQGSPNGRGESRAATWLHDFAASIVVFLVALPLCMGIAIACGAPVSAGLLTGIIAGIVAGSLSGCQLQVSGPAAGLTVIVFEGIRRFGLETFGLVVLMVGLLQLAAAGLRLGPWFRAVSPAVIKGMLAGIGVLIFASQFHVMLDDIPKSNGLTNLATIPAAVQKAFTHPVWSSAEERRTRRDLLQRIGEVHRQQISLHEQALARIPEALRAPAPADAGTVPSGTAAPGAAAEVDVPAASVALADLAIPQREQATRLDTLLDEAEAAFRDRPEQLAMIQEAHRDASAALERATAALVANDPVPTVEWQVHSVARIEDLQTRFKNHEAAALIGLLTIAVLVLWKPLVPKRIEVIPAPLVAVLAATAAATLLSAPVLSVEVPDSVLGEIRLPDWSTLSSAPWGALFGTALLMAAVASAETLLSATAVDQLHNGPRARYDRELFSQGVGNVLCGLIGALPMTGVIVRSSANVHAGARTRLSAVLHGIWLLLFVAAFSPLLRMVPTACLAGILVYTGYKLLDLKAIRELRKFGWSEVAIYAATVTVIVVFDLLSGVLTGIALSAAKLLYTFSQLRLKLVIDPEARRATLRLSGVATFVRLPQLAAELDRVPRGWEFHLDAERLQYIDHACLDLLMNWAAQQESSGGDVAIDWPLLRHTVRNGARTPKGGGRFEIELRDASSDSPPAKPVAAGDVRMTG